MEHDLLNILFAIIGILGIAVASSLSLGILRLPYTVGMVLVGIVIAVLNIHAESSETVLSLLCRK
jgi:Kef-type K+ transport system membrane component KefB